MKTIIIEITDFKITIDQSEEFLKTHWIERSNIIEEIIERFQTLNEQIGRAHKFETKK